MDLASSDACVNIAGQVLVGCKCYTVKQREKIAQAITDLAKCQLEVTEKDRLINERLTTYNDSGSSEPHWWQDPMFVWGGIGVSFSVGAALGYFLAR